VCGRRKIIFLAQVGDCSSRAAARPPSDAPTGVSTFRRAG